jgi:hypothetical protein
VKNQVGTIVLECAELASSQNGSNLEDEKKALGSKANSAISTAFMVSVILHPNAIMSSVEIKVRAVFSRFPTDMVG